MDRFEIVLKNNEITTYIERNGFFLTVPGDVKLISGDYFIIVKKSGDANTKCIRVVKVIDKDKLYVSQKRVYLRRGERQKFDCDGLSIEIIRVH
jgi:hypothetical protein